MTTEHRARGVSRAIAAEVRAEMARQSLTQQQLANRLGVTQWWVSRRTIVDVPDAKRTRSTPIGAAELVLIAEALQVPVSRLLRTAIDREQVAA